MAKKKANTGGAESRRSRGLKSILVPLTPEQHQLIGLAARVTAPPGPAVTRWAAFALEAAARQAIADAGVTIRKKTGNPLD